MIQNYKLDKLFGPSASFAGYLLLGTGLITVYFTLTAIPLILIGGALAFSFYGSEIDTIKKCYRINLNLFGFYPIGKWCRFYKTDQILVQQFTGRYTAFSRGNRQLDISVSDYRVVLILENGNKKIHLAKFPTESQALDLAKQLQLLL